MRTRATARLDGLLGEHAGGFSLVGIACQDHLAPLAMLLRAGVGLILPCPMLWSCLTGQMAAARRSKGLSLQLEGKRVSAL